MEDMAISKDLKALIEANQNQLKTAIRNHQVLVAKLKEDPDNTDVQKDIQEAQQSIVIVGLEQFLNNFGGDNPIYADGHQIMLEKE
ncbi:hypothetical protein QE152_g14209 [Popillia japonica]|uniref:Uncharacterized protein n=1 Tax=Popillia japonica TaxID=7064 RepID=A0AAW1LA92_POPJA